MNTKVGGALGTIAVGLGFAAWHHNSTNGLLFSILLALAGILTVLIGD